MSAFLTRLFMAAVLFTAVLPSLAHPNNSARNAPKCGKKEFFFAERGICLPNGGPPDHPKPPKGFSCPPSGWAWANQVNGCIPTSPPQHAPQCAPGWEWCQPEWACKPEPPKQQPPPPKPSKKAGHKAKRMEIPIPKKCPIGYDACPIPTATGLSDDFECIDTSTELESCGGCVSLGQGTDCTAIPHAWNVACNRGKCEVSSCAPGYTLSKVGAMCVPA